MKEEIKSLEEAIKMVSNTLLISKPWGLECEVLGSALVLLKSNPCMSIEDVLTCAINEWIK